MSRSVTTTGGREATGGVIRGRWALSVGKPDEVAPEGFKWLLLTDLARLEGGHTPSRKHPEFWNGDIPWIGVRDATGNHGLEIFETRETVTQLGIDNSSARVLPAGTVCLSRTASIGYVVMMGRPMATSQAFVNWVCGPGINARYLKYILQLEQESIRRFAYGTAHQTMYYPEAKAFHVCVPSRTEQDKIVGVLGALDHLIEVNRGLVSDQLELVNAEFARRFADEQLSLPLGDIARVTDCLHSKKPERAQSERRLLQLSNISDSGLLDLEDLYGISDDDYRKWTKNLETREWDCVITNVGRVGAVARIPEGIASALGRNMTAIRPESPEVDGAFILAALLSGPVRREISLKTDSGTVMDALNVKNIPSLRLPQASVESRLAFQGFAQPLLRMADALTNENMELRATRDELLPLLMSGRIRVGEESAA